MDIIGPIVVIVICIIIFSICGWCCKKKREGTVYGCKETLYLALQLFKYHIIFNGHIVHKCNPIGSTQDLVIRLTDSSIVCKVGNYVVHS